MVLSPFVCMTLSGDASGSASSGRGVTQENWGRPTGGTDYLVDMKSGSEW